MKKNKIVLLMTACIFLIMLIAALIVLRKDMRSILSKAEKELRYYPVEVSSFNKLNLPAQWNIKIRQDRECKVELAAEGNVLLKPDVTNIDGRLIFQADTTSEALKSANIYARITMPSITSINAGKRAKILMDNFQLDSLHVVLEDGVFFTARNTGFKNLSFKTSGEVSIRLKNMIAN